ncbi:uncharacterized protein LOC120196706 [Hibiscus syriacus]|uniref:uncharacterized protein LOC120196706 n=1 Tax=Hibiscus syriacus TaxID=106335 RepID=UPI0019240FD3|nr:uncharacterized protein LOC120196706 [Hibiscus syriacus]
MAVNQTALLKVGLCVLGLCLFGYIVGPPLYWHFMEGLAAVSHTSTTCSPCLCDCSSQPLRTIPEGLNNASFAGQFPVSLSSMYLLQYRTDVIQRNLPLFFYLFWVFWLLFHRFARIFVLLGTNFSLTDVIS